MGSSSKSQTVGHKRFARIMIAIGNTIEALVGINIDKRKWFYFSEKSVITDGSTVSGHYQLISDPNLFGNDEGGVEGVVSVYTGGLNQLAHSVYADYLESIGQSRLSYPGLAYLSFDGVENSSRGFYFGNSGYMKEMMLWPKRVNIQPDGSPQWYIEKAAINGQTIESDKYTKNLLRVVEGITALSQLSSFASLSLDETLWEEAPGPYGSGVQSGMGTQISSKANRAILLRKWLDIDLAENMGDLVVRIQHDDGGVIYVNGIQYPTTVDDYYNSTATIPSSALVDGRNLIFAAAVDTVPSGTAAGIYLQLEFTLNFKNANVCDLNIAHKLREIFTSDLALNYSEDLIDDVSFRRAADQFAIEKLGVSWAVQQKDCGEAIDELCFHGECKVRRNRQTGKVEVVLQRDDWFDESAIPSFSDNDFKDLTLGWINIDEVVNTLNVKWYNYNRLKTEGFGVRNLGSYYTYGDEIAEDVDFKWFTSKQAAFKVASWKLKYASTPHIKGSVKIANLNARKLNRFDEIFIASASSELAKTKVRITKIDIGNGVDDYNTEIEFEQVLSIKNTEFAYSFEEPKKKSTSILPCEFKPSELSYRDLVLFDGQAQADLQLSSNPLYSKPIVMVRQAQSNSINAKILFDEAEEGISNYCASFELAEDIGLLTTSLKFKNPSNIYDVEINDILCINDERLLLTAIDLDNKMLTVARGADFTMPAKHLADSVMFVIDSLSMISVSDYSGAQSLSVKALPATMSGILQSSKATAKDLTLRNVPIRPLPPGRVTIDDLFYPTAVEEDIVDVKWVHRNKELQTATPAITFMDPTTILEDGVEYVVKVYNALNELIIDQNIGATNLFTLDMSSESQNKFTIIISTLKNGFECAQPFKHEFLRSSYFSQPYGITFEIIQDSSFGDIVLQSNMGASTSSIVDELNGKVAIKYGDVNFVESASGNYLEFLGGFLDYPASSDYSFNGVFEIEMIFEFSNHNAYGGLLHCATDPSNWTGWNILFENTTNFIMIEAGGPGNLLLKSSSALIPGTRYKLKIQRDSSNLVSMYINDELHASATSSLAFAANVPIGLFVERTRDLQTVGKLYGLRVRNGSLSQNDSFPYLESSNLIKYDYTIDGNADSFSYYKSSEPFDNSTKPAAAKVGILSNQFYDEYADEDMYIAISSVKNGLEKLSDIIHITSGPNDPFWNVTDVLILPKDKGIVPSAIYDFSKNAYTVQMRDNVKIADDLVTGEGGKGVEFDGNSDRLAVYPKSPGSGDFTIDVDFISYNYNGGNARLVQFGDVGESGAFAIIRAGSAITVERNNGSWSTYINVPNIIELNKKYRITLQKTAGVIRLFLDGVYKAQSNWSGFNHWSGRFYIGQSQQQSGGTDALTGMVKVFRYTLASRYDTTGFTPEQISDELNSWMYDRVNLVTSSTGLKDIGSTGLVLTSGGSPTVQPSGEILIPPGSNFKSVAQFDWASDWIMEFDFMVQNVEGKSYILLMCTHELHDSGDLLMYYGGPNSESYEQGRFCFGGYGRNSFVSDVLAVGVMHHVRIARRSDDRYSMSVNNVVYQIHAAPNETKPVTAGIWVLGSPDGLGSNSSDVTLKNIRIV